MNKDGKKEIGNDVNNETEGLGFALTLIAALGTIIYTIYNYLLNTPIEPTLFIYICYFISCAFILIIGLFIYIILKGFSIEIEDKKHKKYLNTLSSHLYLMIFSLTPFVFIFLTVKAIDIHFKNKFNFNIGSEICVLFIFIIYIIFITIIFWPKIRKVKNSEVNTKILKTVGIFLLWSVLLLSFLPPLLHFLINDSPFGGQIEVDMQDTYYTKDIQIPISIQITGPDTGLRLLLYKKEFSGLIRIDYIEHIPKNNTNYKDKNNLKIGSNNTLLASSLGSGKYIVFINTTELNPEYYELMFLRTTDKVYHSQGFYLLNNS